MISPEELMQDNAARAEVEEANKIERAVATAVETMALRVPAFEALKHLIITGMSLFIFLMRVGCKSIDWIIT